MPTIIQSAHDRLVREVADRYIRDGYYVQIAPSEAELPAFLHGYHPDLIVKTPTESIVIEVKSKGKVRRLAYWEGLKNAVESQPGWRFQFVLDNRREEELIGIDLPTLSREEIEMRLTAGKELADNGLLDSALLVVWSTLEAILREASRKADMQLPNQGPASLITALYTESTLPRKDYDALMHILELRNRAAHGFRVENMDRSLVDQAQHIARRLIKQYLRAA